MGWVTGPPSLGSDDPDALVTVGAVVEGIELAAVVFGSVAVESVATGSVTGVVSTRAVVEVDAPVSGDNVGFDDPVSRSAMKPTAPSEAAVAAPAE